MPGIVARQVFLGSSRDYMVEMADGTQVRVVAPVADPELATSIRRLVTKDLLARQSLGGGGHPADPQPSERGNS